MTMEKSKYYDNGKSWAETAFIDSKELLNFSKTNSSDTGTTHDYLPGLVFRFRLKLEFQRLLHLIGHLRYDYNDRIMVFAAGSRKYSVWKHVKHSLHIPSIGACVSRRQNLINIIKRFWGHSYSIFSRTCSRVVISILKPLLKSVK